MGTNRPGEAHRAMGARAVVLEIDGDSAIVLKEGGQFLRVPLRGRRWRVGQEVRLEEPVRRPVWRALVAWGAAAAVLVAVFAGFLVTPAAARPAGYVTVDIDPASIGLITDRWAAVLGVEPLTEAAAALVVDRERLKGQPVDRVIVLLVERAAGTPAGATAQVVVIAAAPLQRGQGLPPAVRQAVTRAQQAAARVLDGGEGAAAAAVIAVDEPEVGPELGRAARRQRVSVARSALWIARQLEEAGEPGRQQLEEVVRRLEQVPSDEVHRVWAAPEPLPALTALKVLLGDSLLQQVAPVLEGGGGARPAVPGAGREKAGRGDAQGDPGVSGTEARREGSGAGRESSPRQAGRRHDTGKEVRASGAPAGPARQGAGTGTGKRSPGIVLPLPPLPSLPGTPADEEASEDRPAGDGDEGGTHRPLPLQGGVRDGTGPAGGGSGGGTGKGAGPGRGPASGSGGSAAGDRGEGLLLGNLRGCSGQGGSGGETGDEDGLLGGLVGAVRATLDPVLCGR